MIAYVNGDGYHFNFIDISTDIDSAENEETLYAFFVHLHDNIVFATGKCEFLKTWESWTIMTPYVIMDITILLLLNPIPFIDTIFYNLISYFILLQLFYEVGA